MEQLLNKGHSWKGLVLENLEVVSSVIRRPSPSLLASPLLLSSATAPHELTACKCCRCTAVVNAWKLSSAEVFCRTAKQRML